MEDDRVVNVMRSGAGKQGDLDRTDTLGLIVDPRRETLKGNGE
jgi:hypothetical protein